jgi:ABC-type multidrug transport system fused ATPase/permease subunit
VNAMLKTRFRDHTVISVAHRLDSAPEFDRVVVMDEGQVAENDRPDVLLSRPSIFRELYESQHHRDGVLEG